MTHPRAHLNYVTSNENAKCVFVCERHAASHGFCYAQQLQRTLRRVPSEKMTFFGDRSVPNRCPAAAAPGHRGHAARSEARRWSHRLSMPADRAAKAFS